MEAEWGEVQQLQLPPLEPSVLYDPKQPAPAIAFDTQQELLWVGNEAGRITSYYGAGLQKHTSFRAHPSYEGRVASLLFHDRGVLSLASGSVHLASRRGLTLWHILDAPMKNLRCMSFLNKENSEILVAGCNGVMFTIDVERGVVLQEIPTEYEYTIMKLCRYICAATNTGAVHFLNPETFDLIKTWQAHHSEIHDMDAHSNYLVTCGKAPRPYGPQSLEHFAKVYDIQKLQQLSPINFPGGAAFIRIVPKLSTTAVIATQTGRLQVVDLMNPDTVNLHQADVAFIRTLILAPSGSVWAMLDQDNNIRLWGGSREKMRYAENPNPTEFADDARPVTFMGFDSDLPFSTVGMPYYHEKLLSAWPSDHVFEVGHIASKTDPDVLKSMVPNSIGYRAPNPRKILRNQSDRTKVLDKDGTAIAPPKFLSERSREPGIGQTKSNVNGRRISDAVEAFANASLAGSTNADVPIEYRNVEIKYSKFGVQDFDFHYYNKTQYSGLETHITNSYLNPLLQLLKFTPLIRNFALNHVASGCLFDLCLLCEMGFLFDMVEKAAGQSCQATNLYKSLGGIPDAAGLQILEEKTPQNNLDYRVQTANRFVLKQISSDSRRIYPDDSRLDQVLVTSAMSTLRCLHCYSETVRASPSHVTDLSYPSLNQNSRLRNAVPTFSEVLKRSLEYATQIRAWCNKCRRYQELATRTTVHNVAPVLMLNACLDKSPDSRQLWGIPGWLPEQIGIILDGGKFSCLEGESLRNLRRTQHHSAITIYDLVGVVAEINSKENQKSHLVSLINVAISKQEHQDRGQWHLMNDFLVRKVDDADRPLHFFPNWKTPVIIAYQIQSARHAVDNTWKNRLDISCLFDRWSMNSVHDPRNLPLDPETDEPRAGSHVAIDGEFVNLRQEEIEIKADGDREVIRPTRMGLARVSVLRGDPGPYEGVPFVNDYIPIYEPIVDYNTQYSGLREGDLDPRTSHHPLVPLKVAYKKLWLLLNLGCIFVGHGLPKDLRVANIHVPKSQIIDTADLFFIASRKRRLSLAFLAWFILKEEIQQQPEGHDSIEDALTALQLWRKYKEYKDAGVLEQILEDVYREGRRLNFRPPDENGIVRNRDGRSTDMSNGRETPPPMRGPDSGAGTPVGRRIGRESDNHESPLK